jgi:hypothetical protein
MHQLPFLFKYCQIKFMLKVPTILIRGKGGGLRDVFKPVVVLSPWELEMGSEGRPKVCLVEGFVRTLKNYFKTTCREYR